MPWITSPREACAQESQLDGLKAAARGGSTDPSAALAYGRALRRAGHPVEALGEIRRGIGLAAAKPDVMMKLHWEVARVYIDRRDFDQTVTECQVLGKLPGAGAEGHACTAAAYLIWQRSTEALVESAAALARDPRCFEAKLAEGRAHELALDVAKSEAAYRAALAMRSDSVAAHVGLGRMLAKNGRRDDGVAELRRALSLDAGAPDALFELGQARRRRAPRASGSSSARRASGRRSPTRGSRSARSSSLQGASPTRRSPPRPPSGATRGAPGRRSSRARWRSPRAAPTTRSARASRR